MSLAYRFGIFIKSFVGGSSLLNAIELRYLRHFGDNNLSPVFIIGLPRSGTTLLFQLLISSYKFSFFSNIANVFYRCTSLVLFLFQSQHMKYVPDNFKSYYGFTKGIFAPSEGGAIFRYWFDRQEQVDNKRINKTIDAYTKVTKAPFLFKNLNAFFHLEKVTEIFPEAHYILVQRDLKFVCQSIHNNNIVGEGINIQGLSKSELMKYENPLIETARRLKNMDTILKDKLTNLNIKYICVGYSDLCNSPHKVIDEILRFYQSDRLIERVDKKSIPRSFRESKNINLTEDEWFKLVDILDK